jgi:hypothetical protein
VRNARLLAIALLALIIGLPVLAQNEDDAVSEPSIETPMDAAAEEAPPGDESAPPEETAPAEEIPTPGEPAPAPAEPTAPPAPGVTRPVLTPIPGVQDIQITLRDDFTITVSPSTVHPGRSRFIITNEGRLSHGLGDGNSVEQFVAPGATLTRELQLNARTWMLYCPVADHASRGMRAQLVVQ